MAATGSPTTTSQLTAFIPNYWDTVLGENLYPNLYFYQFGTKRTVPRNFGNTIKIPRLKKQNIVFAINSASEGVPIGTCPISDQFISGGMNQFAGAYKHSDVLVMTALSDVIELSLIDIARDIARRIDRSIRNALSGIGLEHFSNPLSGGIEFNTHASMLHSNAILKPADIIYSVVTLDNVNNPRPPDNHYPAIIHPVSVYDLQTNLSGGAWLDVTKYTEGNADRIYLGEVGRLYGARFITSSDIKRQALSDQSTSGVQEYMFAPDSYYVTEISDMTAKTYVKQLGSAGTADPVNQQATVGAKVYFGTVPATWDSTEYRMVRMSHATSIAGGDTTS
jgi:N4-gp56 family major capsid protein